MIRFVSEAPPVPVNKSNFLHVLFYNMSFEKLKPWKKKSSASCCISIVISQYELMLIICFCAVLLETQVLYNSTQYYLLNFLLWDMVLKLTWIFEIAIYLRNFFSKAILIFLFCACLNKSHFQLILFFIHNLLHALNCLKMGFWK